MKTAENQPNELKRSMKARHLFMISIGDVLVRAFSLVQAIPFMKQEPSVLSSLT